MNDKVSKLKENFEKQLEATTRQMAQLRADLEQLGAAREQLKGAIFALTSVMERTVDSTAAEAPKPAETKPDEVAASEPEPTPKTEG